MLRETEALALIADLEQMELNKLNTNNLIGAASTLVDSSEGSLGGGWREQMAEFLTKGEIAFLRRALRDDEGPLFLGSELARMSLTGGLDVDFSDQAGARILKALPVKRALRRRMLQARWAVHFFSGVGPHPEISFGKIYQRDRRVGFDFSKETRKSIGCNSAKFEKRMRSKQYFEIWGLILFGISVRQAANFWKCKC